MRAVRDEGRKQEECSVTCSAVEFEPKPLGPAIPAKYLRVAFMGSFKSVAETKTFEGETANTCSYFYT